MTSRNPDPLPGGWSTRGAHLWQAGQKVEGIQAVLDEWQAGWSATLALQACYYMFLLNDTKMPVRVLEHQLTHTPDHVEVRLNLAVCCSRSGLWAQALEHAQGVIERDPHNAVAWDSQASTLAHLERFDEAAAAGTRALQLKHEASLKGATVQTRVRRSSAADPPAGVAERRQVLSFSLWGQAPRYLRGAIRNALLAPDLYPGWVCRFETDDSVPADFLDALRGLGCEVRQHDAAEPLRLKLARRFFVAHEADVGLFAVRDVDSVINLREREAVTEWMRSGQPFHAMRDWWTHTDLLLAGMWGGTAGLLPNLREALLSYRPPVAETPNIDQWFLRDVVWPLIHDRVLVHDRCFAMAGSRPFPGTTPPGNRHVGQDEFAARRDFQAGMLRPWMDAVPSLRMPAAAA